MALVFQYGSNCSAERLNRPTRLNGLAQVSGIAETAKDYTLAFEVWSDGNKCAASDIVSAPGWKVWDVLYEIPDDFVHGRRKDGKKTRTCLPFPLTANTTPSRSQPKHLPQFQPSSFRPSLLTEGACECGEDRLF